MSQTLTVAYSELTRVLPWSLRALGYPFGTADRAAHLVANAAAMEPRVLDDIAQARNRPSGRSRYRRSDDMLVIDAENISLLETGPVAIDHLAAHADGVKVATCLVAGATEPSLLPAIVAGAADYGLCGVALVAQEGVVKWHLACQGYEGSVLVSGADRTSLLALLAGQDPIAEQVRRVDLAAGAVALMVGAGSPALEGKGHTVTRPAERVAAAHRAGIPVSRGTLDALYALETLTWAPTSERSRAQAGFTMPAEAAR